MILSGLLANQMQEVRSAYESRFEFDPPQFEEDWVLLSARRSAET